jgi:hypothetical protein
MSDTVKAILFVLLGGVLTFVALKILAGEKSKSSPTAEKFKALIKTPEASAVAKTEEFTALILSPAFSEFAKTIAQSYIQDLLNAKP